MQIGINMVRIQVLQKIVLSVCNYLNIPRNGGKYTFNFDISNRVLIFS